MTITPFLVLHLGGKRDALLARRRARRAASLLSFDGHEQACIAAGSFHIACQALMLFGKARLCFQVENHHLQVFAEDATSAPAQQPMQPIAQRLAGLFPEDDAKLLFRLVKPLPMQQTADELDVGWLVQQLDQAEPKGVFEEIVKQNQEILALLHELRAHQQDMTSSTNPHAA